MSCGFNAGDATGFLSTIHLGYLYITIDWISSNQDLNGEWWFTNDIGNKHIVPWKTVASVDGRLQFGDQIVIEDYQDKGVFRVVDEGTKLLLSQVDVFIGILPYAEVHSGKYETFHSRVGLVR